MLALAEGFGERPCAALLAHGADPERALRDPPAPPDVPPRVAARLRRRDLEHQAAGVRATAERAGLCVLTPAHDDWPPQLREQAAPPLALFVRGERAALRAAPAVAVVGSRTPTPYGLDAAQLLGAALGRAGVSVWSGLARGVDGAVHRAGLLRGAGDRRRHVAVLAGGLPQVYPPEHAALADDLVAAGGCLVSELPPGRRARRGHFLRRNRLLAAGASATVVVEGSLVSGALHTARQAAECGRDVYCVPGPWTSERSQGCHRLIRDGAELLEAPDALLQALGISAAVASSMSLRLARDADAQALLGALRAGPRPSDLLQREASLDTRQFLRAVSRLEQDGVLERVHGDLWRAREPDLRSR